MPYPSVRVIGVDASASALRLARDNATALLEDGWMRQAGRSVTCEFAEVDLLQRSPQPPLPAPSADPLANALLNPPACVSELVRLAGAPSSASSSSSARPSPLLSSLSSTSSSLGGPYHLLVSNPPYIPSAELATLEPEVRLWEDPAALIAGTDGMQLYDVILRALPSLLRPLPLRSVTSSSDAAATASSSLAADGELDASDWDVPELVLEIGSAMQALQLTERLTELGFAHVTIHHDLADLPRWVAAARKPAAK
jgi:methylase of polypeptide subunit release factors